MTEKLSGVPRTIRQAMLPDGVTHVSELEDGTFLTLRITYNPDRKAIRGNYKPIAKNDLKGLNLNWVDVQPKAAK